MKNNYLNDLDPDVNYFDEIIAENNLFSTYNSIDEFISMNPISISDKNHISIFGQNIRSFNRNLDNFLTMFPENNYPDIFVFSETWHDINNPVAIQGYKAYHTVRLGRSGGVSIFVKGIISSCVLSNFCYANSTIEICSIKITSWRQPYVHTWNLQAFF